MILLIAKKEIYWYLNSPVGYILAAITGVLTNFLFWRTFFLQGTASLRGYFEILPWVLLFLTAGVTMRVLSEEKRSGTIEVLKTLPLTPAEIVWGKFLGAVLVIIFINIINIIGNILTITYLGKPDFGVIFSQILGFLLLTSAMSAIGLYLSSLTKNQIAAMLVTIAVLFVLFIIGTEMFAPQLYFLSLGGHYDNFLRGYVKIGDIIYYLTITIVMLFLGRKKLSNF